VSPSGRWLAEAVQYPLGDGRERRHLVGVSRSMKCSRTELTCRGAALLGCFASKLDAEQVVRAESDDQEDWVTELQQPVHQG